MKAVHYANARDKKTRHFKRLLQTDGRRGPSRRQPRELKATYGPESAALRSELADCFISSQSVEHTYVRLTEKHRDTR